jgi:hypothetical protein
MLQPQQRQPVGALVSLALIVHAGSTLGNILCTFAALDIYHGIKKFM